VIEIRGLTKRYGPTLAVDELTFDVLPGRVTGFLGPHGSGLPPSESDNRRVLAVLRFLET
jgi:ABC-type Na+ transport system ATPase subunit NatA